AVGRAIPALVGSDRCSLFLWDEAAGGFRPAYFSYEEDPAFVARLDVIRPEAVPLAGEVYRQPGPFVISPGDLAGKLPEEWITRVGTTPFVVAPVRSGERLMGALILDNGLTSRPRRACWRSPRPSATSSPRPFNACICSRPSSTT
ncbi:MAG: hypothetical protein HW418_2252, partial [Anaerolineales bacterium]|nr:hypothetical protein [Anaerolineales bacterium]